MLTVGEFLERKGNAVFTVDPSTTVLEAARIMNKERIGAVTVIKDGGVVGMFTERDALNRVVAEQLDPATTTVESVMTAPVITCTKEHNVSTCAAEMSSKKIRHLPVVEKDGSTEKLVGMISTGDLMALNVSQKQAQIDHLHDYLHGRA